MAGSSLLRTAPVFLTDDSNSRSTQSPAFVVFQPANTAFGAGVNPVGLKWIFKPPADTSRPYLELNGGTLFYNA